MTRTETFVGFDSAWTDNPRAPGAICALRIEGGGAPVFHAPRLARFADATMFIDAVTAGADYALIALDQPTIVANPAGMRPAERVAASVVSWLGGGVQPAYRGRTGMFCDAAPIWPFLAAIAAVEDPIAARTAVSGRHLIEVFPALALASFDDGVARRRGAPKYNPANRRNFDRGDWLRVCAAAAASFTRWGFAEPAAWCGTAGTLQTPAKADQDRVDAMLCLAVALHWRRAPADRSIMIGDLDTGYIVAPASPAIRARLVAAAQRRDVPVDQAETRS